MKMIGLGLKDFVKDSFNIFDAVIVAMSIAEITLADEESESGSSFGAMRAVRLFRIFKLFK